MSTYIQGVTDYIPQIQPFKPDFNFFQSALEKKQLQYEAGYNKINSIYSQLLNSPLLRQSNKDRRDNLFSSIDSEIKRLSGVDLSLAENVDQAGKLFTPLINDQYFRKDLAYTKQYQGQLQRAEGLRSNPDPKSDERYWEEGVSALHYMAQDFSNSTDDESLNFAAPTYTPFINTAEKLFKFAKDNDINVTNIDFNGGYIWTYKNGKPAIPAIQNVFSTILNNDSRVKDMFQTQAYLTRKNYIQQNAANFGGDTNQAEQAYLKEKIDQINQYYKQVNEHDERKAQQANTNKKLIEEKIAQRGVDPDVDPELVALYQNSANDASVQQSVLDKNKSVLASTDFMSYDPSNLQVMRQRVDGAMASFLLDDMSGKVASDYAMAKSDVEVKEDPYVKMQVQFKYDMMKLQQEFNNDVVLKLMEVAKGKAENNGDAIPGYDPASDDGRFIEEPGPGGTVSEDQNVIARNQRQQTAVTDKVVSSGKDSIQNFLSYQNGIISSPTASATEKAAAEQAIVNTLGTYNVTETEGGYTYEKDAPTDWTRTGKGLLSLLGMPYASMLGATGVGALYSYASSEIYQGLNSKEKVDVPGKVTKTSGYVTKGADGTYQLVNFNQIPGHDVVGSDNYIGNVQKKIKDYADQNLVVNRDANALVLKTIVDNNQMSIDKKQQVIAAIADANKRNNEKVSTLLIKESGLPTFASSLFMNDQKTAPRTENEFIVEYVKAAKRDKALKLGDPNAGVLEKYASAFGLESVVNPFKGTMDDSDYTEDAVDAYEKLSNTYERLSKTSELGLESYDQKLLGEAGINRFYTGNALYTFDAAAYKNKSFKLAMDFLKKDLLPNTVSNSANIDAGVKVIAGVSGTDVTSKDYANMQHDPKAAAILKDFLLSATRNYGGKTGENVIRPTGSFILNAVAANDANKVAMTWEISPEWLQKHAGTANNKGIAWDLQEQISEGKASNQIAFFMNADKARSLGFTSMQSTDEEMLLNTTGRYTINSDGGQIEFRRNNDGTLSYFGSANSYADGKLVTEPISGITQSDINAAASYWQDVLGKISETNANYKNTLVSNSGNKIYDPNLLLQQ
jgi:hypothetical protein